MVFLMDLEIFSDETIVNEKYIGFGCLFVPLDKKRDLSKELSNLRCLNEKSDKWHWKFDECPNRCQEHLHDFNNTEIHHKKLKDGSSNAFKRICENWLNFLIKNNKENRGLIYFNVLYIDLDKIDEKFFGPENTHINIYSRFYRSVIQRGINFFLKRKAILI